MAAAAEVMIDERIVVDDGSGVEGPACPVEVVMSDCDRHCHNSCWRSWNWSPHLPDGRVPIGGVVMAADDGDAGESAPTVAFAETPTRTREHGADGDDDVETGGCADDVETDATNARPRVLRRAVRPVLGLDALSVLVEGAAVTGDGDWT